MKPRTNGVSRIQNTRSPPGEGPNWILMAGGALLSMLSIRLGYKLKQLQDTKQLNNCNELKEKGRATETNKPESCNFHPNACFCVQEENGCFSSVSYSNKTVGVKQQCGDDIKLVEAQMVLPPVVRIPSAMFSKENNVFWASSPQLLELPQKPLPFHKSNSSGSPSISEAGSNVFANREVIQKLRQQLKRRDEMIMEIQDQIAELQNALNTQLSHSTHLQSLLDTANRNIFASGREIQRLRKAITPVWPTEGIAGLANGYPEIKKNNELLTGKAGEEERVEMLKREVHELKEILEGKEYLLQSYKVQKTEFSTKIKELQHRLDSQLPNFL